VAAARGERRRVGASGAAAWDPPVSPERGDAGVGEWKNGGPLQIFGGWEDDTLFFSIMHDTILHLGLDCAFVVKHVSFSCHYDLALHRIVLSVYLSCTTGSPSLQKFRYNINICDAVIIP
jgi:hypothetical protein